MQKITTFLMFEGQAEEAMNFYISLFPDSSIVSISRYEEGDEHMKGKVIHAVFSLGEQTYMCIDSNVKHAFTFTPTMSLFVDCNTEAEIDKLFLALSQNGSVLMPLGAYPFSKKFAWLSDKFGVSWQLTFNK